MLLIAAALAEELNTALELCNSRTRFRPADTGSWSGTYREQPILFLKVGAGPGRSARKLNGLLASYHPDRILLIGYAGALTPELKIGDLAILQRTSIFGEGPNERRTLEDIEITDNYDLHGSAELSDLALRAGLRCCCGTGLTSPFIIGDPGQKMTLRRRFKALTIDMETAALARVSSQAGIPIASVRAISDEVNDEALAPFSYEPGGSKVGRAMRVLGAGKWRERFALWRGNAGRARESLRVFLRYSFETWSSSDPNSSWLTNSLQ